MRYSVGDRVRIVKPDDIQYDEECHDSSTSCHNSWVTKMDLYDQRIATIVMFYDESGWAVVLDGEHDEYYYILLEDWLQPINESQGIQTRLL